MSVNPYASREWRSFRAQFLSLNPRCVCTACSTHKGKTCGAVANTVDHVTPARAGGVRLFQAMCASCHSRKTATYDGGFGNAR